MKEILEIIQARTALPHLPFALATVVRVEGSSYRRPGARMLIGAHGRVAGSVSGGCLERDVVSKGLAVILNREAQLVAYDTTDQDDMAFGTALGCEGRIEIAIEPLLPGLPWTLGQTVPFILDRREPLALATVYRGKVDGRSLAGHAFTLGPDGAKPEAPFGPELASPIEADMKAVLAAGKTQSKSYTAVAGTLDVLIERLAPPVPLLIFGGGHDAPPLVRLAKELGYQVTVVDRRPDFADPASFPGADRVVCAKPRQVADRFPIDPGAAAVIMNHHYETDRDFLGILLSRKLAYLGIMGPRKRTDRIIAELEQAGAAFPPENRARLHAPIGLDLGSENPEQIALSILAEIQATLAGRTAVQLRSRSAPIHAA
jgi:xanthine dehydrogenase accessory factor